MNIDEEALIKAIDDFLESKTDYYGEIAYYDNLAKDLVDYLSGVSSLTRGDSDE
jgi:hypothetical protein